jgi:hypothetical protein
MGRIDYIKEIDEGEAIDIGAGYAVYYDPTCLIRPALTLISFLISKCKNNVY